MIRDFDNLLAYLDARRRTPFAWGTRANDCVSFAGGAVEALTGDDVLGRCGHTWSTARGAARVLHQVGGVAGAADLMLPRLLAPAFALRGDVGLVELDGRPCLVVFEGELLVGPGEAGRVYLPRPLALAAWSATPLEARP